VITGFWFISQIISWSPVYERDFDPSDHLISFSHKKNQYVVQPQVDPPCIDLDNTLSYRIGSSVNHFVALLAPFAVFAVVGFSRGSLQIIHHATIGLSASRFGMCTCTLCPRLTKSSGFARLITQVLKHSIGKLSCIFILNVIKFTCSFRPASTRFSCQM